MRRTAAIIATGALLFLTGCSGDDNDPRGSDAAPTTEAAEPSATARETCAGSAASVVGDASDPPGSSSPLQPVRNSSAPVTMMAAVRRTSPGSSRLVLHPELPGPS